MLSQISSSFFVIYVLSLLSSFFFFNDTATTEIYTLSLHDALPIFRREYVGKNVTCKHCGIAFRIPPVPEESGTDRKSTRLNSSHDQISYAVFCLKKKKKKTKKQ